MTTPEMTPLALFMEAGLVGKGVIIVLFALSVWCWVLIAEGWLGARKLERAVAAAREGSGDTGLLAPIVAAGAQASALAIPGESLAEERARISEAMHRAAAELLMRVEGGLPNLAIISSVAPFIGLFGTVWGIMNSFAGIAQAQDTSLAVVAPGIAEALAATAIGLAAAIPASVGYNRIAASLGRAAQRLGHAIEERTLVLARRGAARPVPDQGAA
jgi:biopolymer transport protein ExbB/TolQ